MKSVKLLICLIVFAALAVAVVRYLMQPKIASPKVITVHSRGLQFQEELNSPFGGVLSHGMHINVSPEIIITLLDGGNEYATTTQAATVGDLILQKKIPLAATDRVTPALSSYLAEGLRVQIDRIVDLEEARIEEIPYAVTLSYDNTEYYGRETVIVPGAAGEKEQKFVVTYRNGVETRRKLISEKTIRKPQTETRKFGTRIEVVEETQGRASWYAYKNCLCAAAPYYDIGRYVRVTSLASGKSTIVRINDHGPDTTLHPDRVIDLDAVAFKELAPLGAGTIAVKAELLRN